MNGLCPKFFKKSKQSQDLQVYESYYSIDVFRLFPKLHKTEESTPSID